MESDKKKKAAETLAVLRFAISSGSIGMEINPFNIALVSAIDVAISELTKISDLEGKRDGQVH